MVRCARGHICFLAETLGREESQDLRADLLARLQHTGSRGSAGVGRVHVSRVCVCVVGGGGGVFYGVSWGFCFYADVWASLAHWGCSGLQEHLRYGDLWRTLRGLRD